MTRYTFIPMICFGKFRFVSVVSPSHLDFTFDMSQSNLHGKLIIDRRTMMKYGRRWTFKSWLYTSKGVQTMSGQSINIKHFKPMLVHGKYVVKLKVTATCGMYQMTKIFIKRYVQGKSVCTNCRVVLMISIIIKCT